MFSLFKYEFKKFLRYYPFYFLGVAVITMLFVTKIVPVIISRVPTNISSINQPVNNFSATYIWNIIFTIMIISSFGLFSSIRRTSFTRENISMSSSLHYSLPYSTASRLSVFLIMTFFETVFTVVILTCSTLIVADSFISSLDPVLKSSAYPIPSEILLKFTIYGFLCFYLSQLFIFLSYSIAKKILPDRKRINVVGGLIYALILSLVITFLIYNGNGIVPSILGLFFLDFMNNSYLIIILLVLLSVLIAGTIFYLNSLPAENKNPLYKICTILITLLIVIIFSGQFITYIGRNIDDISYSFEYDDKIIGKWGLVDYVEKPEYFNPDIQSYDISTLGFSTSYTNAQNQTYHSISVHNTQYSNTTLKKFAIAHDFKT